MRRHGWELPYHPLQIIAIAVFLALVFAFYIFIIPFLGSSVLKLPVMASYSLMVSFVFVLYVGCVATDPADVQVQRSRKNLLSSSSDKQSGLPGGTSRVVGKEALSPSKLQMDRHFPSRFAWISSLDCSSQPCACESSRDVGQSEDGMLYCSVCKVEIFKSSKHCRVCDKCVDGFDHHCRWLNNCVGKKNYKGFFLLLVSGILMLIFQWSCGLWILVRFFKNHKQFESIIALKLGKSFSSIAYSAVVALSTLLAMAVTYLLGQLCCFHILLIKKGISTYDYIIAMREQESKLETELAQMSDAPPPNTVSDIGVLTNSKTGRCQPESSVSTQQFDQSAHCKAFSEKINRRNMSVKINPWTLASLKTEDILHSAMLAKSKGSTSQTIGANSEKLIVPEVDSNSDSSRSINGDFLASLGGRGAGRKLADPKLHCVDQSLLLSPWQHGKLSIDSLDSSENEYGNTSQHAESENTLTPLQREAINVFISSHAFSASTNLAKS